MHENFLKRGVQKLIQRVQKNRLRVQKYQNRMFKPIVEHDIDTMSISFFMQKIALFDQK